MKKTFFVAAVCVALAAAGPVLASGGEQGDFELGLYGGYNYLDQYDGFEPENDVLYGARFGYFMTNLCSLELSQQFSSSETMIKGVSPSSQFGTDLNSTRLNLLFNFLEPGSAVRPFVTVGAGREAFSVESNGSAIDFGLNGGAGVRIRFTDNIGLRLEGRYVTSQLETSSSDAHEDNFEAMAGLAFTFGADKTDTDGDGVYDRKDKCPDTPRGALVDASGCPKDTDGDGVYDGIDACPDTPKGYPVDARGCPLDSDGDGVVDGADKCPNTPRGATVDANGCPKDTDGDGVYDGIDRCPDTPKGCMVDAAGCPKDSDGDGVCDGLDKCPGTPRGEAVDATGCSSSPQFEEGKSEVILKGVQFPTNGSSLDAEDMAILDQVASSLADHPEVTLVEIGGHTDSSGAAEWNRKLGGLRADSVVKYLVSKGVASSRMTSRGYGPDVPIADNATVEGRAQNRRTEVKRVN